MSTEKHLSDSADEARPESSPVSAEKHPVQQDAEEASMSDPASDAALTEAAQGAGRQSAHQPLGSATTHGDNNGPQNSSRPYADSAYALAEALDLLRESVRELITKKRRTTAAAVSLQMRRRSNAFTPAATGFATFRDFLRFAEGVGAVTLLPPVPGGDIEVLSATAVGSPAEPAPLTPSPRPIRRDLWQAFVDWSPQWHRAFDVDTGRVVTLPADANSDDIDTSQRRQAWRENSTRFRRVVPLSRDDQLKWMREFVSHLPAGAERDQLSNALDNDHPLSAFAEVTRAIPALQRSWRRHFTEQVTAAITRWMLQEEITADIYHMPAKPREGVATRAGARKTETGGPSQEASAAWQRTDSSGDLRQQVLEAVARMPLSELLRLPIPAEYLLRQ